MFERIVPRLAAASGIAYVVFAMVGTGIGGGGSPDLTASRAEIARWAARQHPSPAHYAGGFLELAGLLSLVVFAATLYAVFRRVEAGSGVLSATVFGAGLVSVAVKLASAGPAFAVYWRHDGMSPQLTAALIDSNNLSFVLTWSLDAVMLGAAAILVLRTRVLPRWLGWLGAAAAVLSLVSTPVANHVPPLGMLLTLVWFLAASVVLTIRRTAGPAVEPAVAL